MAAAALVAAVALGESAMAQGRIRVFARDKDFDAPLAEARVALLELGQQVLTDEQGNAVLADVPAGTYTLTVSKEGYVRLVRPDVFVRDGQLTDLTLDLAGDFTELEEFVVRDVLQLGGSSDAALLNLRFKSPSFLSSIGRDLFSKSGAGNVADALRLVSGATVQDGKSAVIRGLPDRYVSNQLNGVVLPSSDNDKRAVDLDLIPSQVVESVQVSKTFTPDQQANASGGAVNVILTGVPKDDFFVNWSSQGGWNSQVTGRGDFLTYRGTGFDYFGVDRSRGPQETGQEWDGAVGVSTAEAPFDYRYTGSMGGSYEFDSGVKIGAFATFTYQRDSSFYDDGVFDSYWQVNPGDELLPIVTQQDGDPVPGLLQGGFTALYDEKRGVQELNWTSLLGGGIETENHSLTATWLYSRSATDTAVFLEDTRGKEVFFPGHDPDDMSTPGHGDFLDAAPFNRIQTLAYRERITTSQQLRGRHVLPFLESDAFGAPEIDWTVSQSFADSNQPDRRQFASLWTPEGIQGFPPFTSVVPEGFGAFLPVALISVRNVQRIFERVEEESLQWFFNVKLPFEQWDGEEGYFKVGHFSDEVERTFDQDTFTRADPGGAYQADFSELWTDFFPFQDVAIAGTEVDADYRGEQNITGTYLMVDLPLDERINLIAGVRFESTEISITPSFESQVQVLVPSASGGGFVFDDPSLLPGQGAADFDQDDILPAIALTFRPTDEITVRAAFSQTIARPNFKELTIVQQQEFLGGPVFVGNADLQASAVTNYDLRVDYQPYEGGLISASWFYKDVKDAIELVQLSDPSLTNITRAENYPDGFLQGFELETRQDLGFFAEELEGLTIGSNVTFIESEVSFPDAEAELFQTAAGVDLGGTRSATNAPEYLFNAFASYDAPVTKTRVSVFYTVTGDTLIAGPGVSDSNLIPSLWTTEVQNLNAQIAQNFNGYVTVRLAASNLLNPDIKTVYREDAVPGGDVINRRFTRGVDYSLQIGGSYRF